MNYILKFVYSYKVRNFTSSFSSRMCNAKLERIKIGEFLVEYLLRHPPRSLVLDYRLFKEVTSFDFI